jgi:hypothetical protein
MSRIRVNHYADCPFSAAIELAEKTARRRPDLFVSPAPPFGERVLFTAASTDDRTDEARKHDALLVAWRPETAAYPEFRAVLTARPERRGTLLSLYGDYEPPYGGSGKFFDLLIGRSIARRTMRRFLAGLAADVEAAYAEERKHYKSA